MSEDHNLEQFLDRVLQRPLPDLNNPVARVRAFARELAEGVYYNIWRSFVEFHRTYIGKDQIISYENKRSFHSREFSIYLHRRWNDIFPDLELLANVDYILLRSDGFEIKKSAFDLVQEIEPSTIFISYKRNESSAFALLLLSRLKVAGLDAHLDMAIQPGDNWHAHLKEQIQMRDYFILLLGKKTLTSEVVCKEILWALEAEATIIPIWHNGFQYKGLSGLDPRIDEVLRNTHTIRVNDESALGYETGLIELLNFFGITP